MRLYELFNESGYYPPDKIEDYSDNDKAWDYMRTEAFSEIDEVLNLRDYILEESNNYTIPPITAFGKEGKKELIYAVYSLKKYFQEYENAQIIKIIDEIISYMNSMG